MGVLPCFGQYQHVQGSIFVLGHIGDSRKWKKAHIGGQMGACVADQWKYLYRAINLHGVPEKITINKSGAATEPCLTPVNSLILKKEVITGGINCLLELGLFAAFIRSWCSHNSFFK